MKIDLNNVLGLANKQWLPYYTCLSNKEGCPRDYQNSRNNISNYVCSACSSVRITNNSGL